MALVAPTAADARDVMVGLDPDSSGLLQVCPPWFRPNYEPSKRRVVWPNGAVGTLYSGEEPERLRGPQHDLAWCDEPASWQYLEDSWDNLMFGLRRGESQCIVTGTPKPHPWIIKMTRDEEVTMTKGSTYENVNLSARALKRLEDRYEGTRLGRQELHGEILDDTPGALWSYSMFEKNRVLSLDDVPSLSRIIVPIDVAVSSNKKSSAQSGITVVGVGECFCRSDPPEMHGFVLGDYSEHLSPDEVLKTALQAFKIHQADRIIGEVNNGGDWIEALLRTHDKHVPYKAVRATRGKIVRAEPISALYEQGRIHHVGSNLNLLEDQMVTFTSGMSAGLMDRVDSVVWGFTELYNLILPSQDGPSTVSTFKLNAPEFAGLGGRVW